MHGDVCLDIKETFKLIERLQDSLSSGVLKSCWMGGRQSLSTRSFQVAVIPFALGCVILTSRSPGRLHVDNGVYEGIQHNIGRQRVE